MPKSSIDRRVAETAAAASIGGLEFYFGIPGTIGGALRMNGGASVNDDLRQFEADLLG